MRQRCLVASLHFVEFLWAHRLLVIEILVSVECRLGESEVGIRAATSCSAALMADVARSTAARGCASSITASTCPRCMRSPSCTRSSTMFPIIGSPAVWFPPRVPFPLFPANRNVNPLHRQHGDIAHGFWRRGRRLSLTSATAKPGQKHCRGIKRERMKSLRVMVSPQEIEGSDSRSPTPGWRSWYESGRQLPNNRSGCVASLLRRPAGR